MLEYAVKQVSCLESRWRPKGHHHRHKHVMPMRTPGAAEGILPSRERSSDMPLRREYVAKQVSHLEGR